MMKNKPLETIAEILIELVSTTLIEYRTEEQVIDRLFNDLADQTDHKQDWSFMETSEDAVEAYHGDDRFLIEQEDGTDRPMTFRELRQGDQFQSSFYIALASNGWLQDIFPDSPVKYDWSWIEDLVSARRMYEERFPGFSRTELLLDKNGGKEFYQFLTVRRWIYNVFERRDAA